MAEIVQINPRPMSTDKAKLVRYIRDMSSEMAKMANSVSLNFLAYLLYLVVAEGDRLAESDLTAGPESPLQG
jgi:hypothetical protein